ncbi:hypothetical protein [Frankia sp. Cas4]|uniref:hypothetical protein n=1 Tax=Frankia sp. Cas4 TaxID=3073927 RepID=UPI002AD4953A|nr:hypothetical protein [Frankia sp. Cas4]
MTTPSAEIVDRAGARNYLAALHGNVDNTVAGEFETLLGGLANAGLTDPAVLGPIETARELLGAARDGVASAIAALDGGHAAVSEVVSAVDAADSTEFYRDH